MNAVAFAWRSLVRQPARATLGILGVAAVGALLFDMLLLSEGLIVSMRDLLERTGYDIRVTATADLPRTGPRLRDAAALAGEVAALPGVAAVLAVRVADAEIERTPATAGTGTAAGMAAIVPLAVSFEGTTGTGAAPWTVLRGRDVQATGDVVISDAIAAELRLEPGDTVRLRVSCTGATEALPPLVVPIAGIAEFPFESGSAHTVGGRLDTLDAACGGNTGDEADMLLVTSTGDELAAADTIRRARPDLGVATNAQLLGRIQQGGFTYFRQISTVLTTVTLAFSLLLITVLLTVSVNQRLGEIAALRALGLSRRRMVADVLSESALIVGLGGLLSLPLGGLLAVWLDVILRRMPGIPAQLHFFVFQPSALGLHVALLVLTAVVAALYPMRVVATLPIAATLRAEITG